MTEENGSEESPRVFQARNGWLAISQPGSTFIFAEMGSSEEEAVLRFTARLEAWRKLRKERLSGRRPQDGVTPSRRGNL